MLNKDFAHTTFGRLLS